MQKLKTCENLVLSLKPPNSALARTDAIARWCGGCPNAYLGDWLGRRCAGRVLGGGGGQRRPGAGGGTRSRSRIAGGGGRADLHPAVTGRVAEGAGRCRPRRQPVKTESTQANHSRGSRAVVVE